MSLLTVDDFEELDFKDPVSLLAAIQSLSVHSKKDKRPDPKLLSFEDLQREYGLSADYIRTALLAGTVKPANIVLYFTKEDAERLSAEVAEDNPLVKAFDNELNKMVMNYSYKPLLILALLEAETISMPIDKITGFYLGYYRKRAQSGLLIEKDDSVFVHNKEDYNVAKRTILRYPVSVLSKKAFIIYEKNTGIVKINDLLIDYVVTNREDIRRRCFQLLEKYYDNLLK